MGKQSDMFKRRADWGFLGLRRGLGHGVLRLLDIQTRLSVSEEQRLELDAHRLGTESRPEPGDRQWKWELWLVPEEIVLGLTDGLVVIYYCYGRNWMCKTIPHFSGWA